MREVQASEAKTHLPRLLSDVEKGETIVITRHGRAIARIVPEAFERQGLLKKTKADLEIFRHTMSRVSIDEILSARHDEHKY